MARPECASWDPENGLGRAMVDHPHPSNPMLAEDLPAVLWDLRVLYISAKRFTMAMMIRRRTVHEDWRV